MAYHYAVLSDRAPRLPKLHPFLYKEMSEVDYKRISLLICDTCTHAAI